MRSSTSCGLYVVGIPDVSLLVIIYSNDAWLPTKGAIAPAAKELKNMIAKSYPNMITLGKEYINSLNTKKSLKHYVLLPRFNWGLSEWHWNIAGPLVQDHDACCGYSVDVALLAETVIIVANHHEIGLDVENRLLQSGCKIRRINYEDLDPVSSYKVPLPNNMLI